MATFPTVGRTIAGYWRRLVAPPYATVLFGLWLGALVVLVAVLLGQAVIALQAMRTEPHDNLQWAVYQLNSEFLKFEIAVRATSGSSSDEAELRKRFDILYSRIDIINGPVFRDTLEVGTGGEQRARLLDFRAKVDTLLKGPITAGVRQDLIDLITGMSPTISSLAQTTLSYVTARSDRVRQQLEQAVQFAVLGLGGFAVVAGTALAILLLQRRALNRRTASLVRSTQELREAQRIARLGTFSWDYRKDRVVWSDELAQLFGLAPGGSMNGAEFTALVHPEDRQMILDAEAVAAREAAAAGGSTHHTARYRVVRGDGSTVQVDAMAEVVADSAGRPLSMTSTLRDVTREVEREEALRQAKLTAEQATSAKSDFLAMISHELRTPLNGLMGMLSAVDEATLPPPQREVISIAKASADTFRSLLNDILDLSKIEAGKLELESLPFELAPLVRSVADLYSHRASERSILLDVSLAPDLPRFVEGDAARIRQILLNFTDNALKFTRVGSVRIAVTKLDRSSPTGLWLRFAVHDTGIGIPEDRHAEVFSDFNQLDSSYSRRFGGTGLGLAICRRLATLMQGSVGFESVSTVGSTFWVDVPLVLAKATEGLPAVPPVAEASRGLRVLVAEDNLTNQLVARHLLHRLGHSADIAGTGAEAVHAVRSRPYDVVLMDISMPEMDGLEATRQIRQLGGAAGATRIIALTANSLKSDEERFLAAGMDGLLAKPIVLASLANALRSLPGPARDAATGDERRQAWSSPGLEARLRELEDELGAAAVPAMLEAYVADLDRNRTGLAAAIAAADIPAAERFAHSLVGLGLALHAEALRKAANLVQSSIRAGGRPSDEDLSTLDLQAASIATELSEMLFGLS